jgi:hypothetical protein
MKTNRRKFLVDCSTLTLAVGFLPAALATAASAKTPGRAASFADFAAQCGTVFTVSSATAQAVQLELVAVESNASKHPLAHLAPDAQNEKFTLLFRAADRAGLAQDTYMFEHPELGRQEIFIVPARVNGSEPDHYAATFNRPNPAV